MLKLKVTPNMALWYFLLLFVPLLGAGKSQSTNPVPNNQTDLQVAISDMRKMSYHGFVILLKILNSTSTAVRDREMTFLMPNDEELSKVSLSHDLLEDFVLSHSIPTALLLSHLLHFPNGTMVPSNVPKRMFSITNSGRSGLFVNNARVVNPNVCLESMIRCHGISTTITFTDSRIPYKLGSSNLKDSAWTKAGLDHEKKTPIL